MRLAPAQGFNKVVDGNRQHLGLAGNAAADHENHPELAHRIGKTQHRAGKKARLGQRDGHGKEAVNG